MLGAATLGTTLAVGTGGGAQSTTDYTRGHGHFFTRKTFHRPTYCHHCTDMLWGLIGQGYVCEGKQCLFSAPVWEGGGGALWSMHEIFFRRHFKHHFVSLALVHRICSGSN